MSRDEPGRRASSRSIELVTNFTGSNESGSTTMSRDEPGRRRASSRSIEPVTNFTGSNESGSTTMSRDEPGRRRASSRSIEPVTNFTGSNESGSTTMSRDEPGRRRASSRSIEPVTNFTGSNESGRMPQSPASPSAQSQTSESSSVFYSDSEEPCGTTMSRDEPGRRRASSRSIEPVTNFTGSNESGSTTMSRDEPGRRRASSRSIEPVTNFTGSNESGSTTMSRNQHEATSGSNTRASLCATDADVKYKDLESLPFYRSGSLRSTMSSKSISSLSSVPEILDDDIRMFHRPESPSAQSHPSETSSVSRDSGITHSTDCSRLSICRAEDLSEEPPQSAGLHDVACDFCTEKKNKAWKSCLICLRSFCERHVRDHYRYKELEEHQLVEAAADLNVYNKLAELKQNIRTLSEENRALREKLNSLEQRSSTPRLPAYICKGKTPTAANVVLDPETAHRSLILSHNGKQVRMGQKNKVKPGPQRFDRWECVLAKNGFSSGRHYWQVEVNKEFTIGVTKSSAQRNSRFAFAPLQGYWCIFHFWLSFSALEDPVVRLPMSSVPQVLGVCVDVDEKWVTFYNAVTKEKIYTFKNMKLAPEDQVYPIFRTVEKSMDLQINTVV
ncbi:uncharacterized protein LOC132853567 isoform X2 [Tachysurus vachellii]|uniref:uncharacterized protein LOC132853567 isoform X2 n=1 Tax=Tachysurus vachellii TaxID=175792 RepID=UPI00296AEB20|nr:uncharacterized protein LOC132853567 isoform X2 [Tachysurus vachellii]